MGFSFGRSGRKQVLVYQADKGYELDEDIYYMLREDQLADYVLPFESTIKKNSCRLEYDITACINMRAWLAECSPAEQERTQKIMERARRFLIETGVPEEMLVNEVKYTYINQETGQIQLVCIPLKEKAVKEKRGLGLFGRKAVRKEEQLDLPPLPDTLPVPSDDGGMFEDYGRIEKRSQEEMNSRWSEETFAETDEMEEAEVYIQQEELQKPEDDYLDDFSVPEEEEDELLEGMGSQQENYGNPEPEDDNDDNDDNETVLLINEDDEGTVLLKTIPRVNAKLVRERTGETFPVVNKESMIGKGSKADIHIRNNNTISREHCTISYDAGEYSLEDNKSLNYTYLNGKQLQPGEKAKLESGCEIQMSDEIFHFIIEEDAR